MKNKSNCIEAIVKTNITNQTKFRLDEISKIKNYFIEEINERRSCIKKLSKYVASFDYIVQALIVLSATSSGVSSIVGAPVGIASARITLFFLSNNRNSQKGTKWNNKQKEKA